MLERQKAEPVAVLRCQGMENDREEKEVTFQRGKGHGSQQRQCPPQGSGKGRKTDQRGWLWGNGTIFF